MQAELGARGEHAIRFIRALRDQVTDEDPDVAVGARNDQRLLICQVLGRVDPRDQSLGRRFLVAGCAVDLASQEKPGDGLHLQ